MFVLKSNIRRHLIYQKMCRLLFINISVSRQRLPHLNTFLEDMSRVMDFNKLKSGLTEVQFDCCFPLGFPVKLLFVAHGGSRTLSSMYIPTTPPVKPAISKAPSCCLLDASWLGMGCIWVTFGRFFSLWGRLGGGARVGVAYLGDSTCKGTFQTC